jgi:hypothetical protein
MLGPLLGELRSVPLRDVWTDESGSFTPWFARPENLKKLGDTLGMELESEDEEVAVGPFSANMIGANNCFARSRQFELPAPHGDGWKNLLVWGTTCSRSATCPPISRDQTASISCHPTITPIFSKPCGMGTMRDGGRGSCRIWCRKGRRNPLRKIRIDRFHL